MLIDFNEKVGYNDWEYQLNDDDLEFDWYCF
jgi:hypothetical protein